MGRMHRWQPEERDQCLSKGKHSRASSSRPVVLPNSNSNANRLEGSSEDASTLLVSIGADMVAKPVTIGDGTGSL